MAEKTIKGRLVQKHDVESNWIKATSFIPMKGEMIIYDIDENYSYERCKIGDGVTVVSALPFITDAVGAVKYIEQNLSDEQKAQVRENIGLDGDFLTQDNLQEATNAALAQAKTSGEFDGQSGADGKTPYIQDGNWWIGDTDTGVKAEGVDGYSPVKGTDYYTPDEVNAAVAEIIEQTKSSGDYVSLMGTDPIASLSEDTPIHWARDLSAGYYFITQDGVITDKPSSYGYVVNYRYGNTEVFQFWLSMMYGDVYTRSGNSSGWGTTWKAMNVNKDEVVEEVLAALPTWTGGSY